MDLQFEHVLRVDDWHDGVRKGIALFRGAPHAFRSLAFEPGGDIVEKRSCILVVTLVVVGVSAANLPAFAQSTGVLNATVTDGLTGKPVAGARVTIWCPGCYGRWKT